MGVMDAVREASRGPYPVVSEDTIVEVDTSEATEARLWATGGQGSYPLNSLVHSRSTQEARRYGA